MTGDVIKSFLVGLGFDVDNDSLKKFNQAIASATLKVAALYASVKLAAAGIIYGLSKISEGFEQMGYEFRLVAPNINKVLLLRRELLKAYAAAGINITRVVQQSIRLNLSLTKTKYAFEAIYKSVAAKFFPLLTRQSDLFRRKIYENMPKIQAALERFVKFIFKALEATTALGLRLWSILTRVYDFFAMLHKATDGWSTVILGAVAAWKFLNLAFLATPLGMLITGLTTLLALWDDFKTFQEGGKSLINWGSETTKIFVGLAAAIAGTAAAIYGVSLAIRLWGATVAIITAVASAISVVTKAMRLYAVIAAIATAVNPFTLIIVAVTALIGLLGLLIYKWDVVKAGLASFFGGLGDRVLGFLGGNGSNVAANMQTNPAVNAVRNPLGSAGPSNNTTLHNQTNVTVQAAPDAQATANLTAGTVGRSTYDVIQNLIPKGK